MPRIPNFRSPDDLFKQQATRLRDFLKRGGFDLKHTHALEAIAAVHGAKDFHSLRHGTRANQPESGPVFAVNVYGAGSFIDTTVCNDLQIAIAAFAQEVRMFADLLPDARVLVAAVHGGARTEGLYCFVDDAVMVTLLQACVGDVEKNFEPLLPHVTDLQDQGINDFAYNVTAALYSRKRGPWEARRSKVMHSSAARALTDDPIASIYEQANAAYSDAAVDSEIAEQARALLDKAKVFGTLRAKVTAEGIAL